MVTVSWQQISNTIAQLNQMKNNPDSISDMIAVTNGLHSLLLRYSVEKRNSSNINSSRRVAVVMPSVFAEGNVTTIKNQEHEVMEQEVEELGAAQDYGTQSHIEENTYLENATVEAPVQESISKIQEMEIASTPAEEIPHATEVIAESAPLEANTEDEKIEEPVVEPLQHSISSESDTAPDTQSIEEEKKILEAKPNKQYSIWEAYSSNEIPTLAQQHTQSKPASNETVVVKEDDTFNTTSTAPIKDLKKAISINDRYLFINELFRGEESSYERSIKTINNFNVYQEARYWIDRELKVKLGWDDKNPIAKQFDALVRRRFS